MEKRIKEDLFSNKLPKEEIVEKRKDQYGRIASQTKIALINSRRGFLRWVEVGGKSKLRDWENLFSPGNGIFNKLR